MNLFTPGKLHYFFQDYSGSFPATSEPLAIQLRRYPKSYAYRLGHIIVTFSSPPTNVTVRFEISNDGVNWVKYIEEIDPVNGWFSDVTFAGFVRVVIPVKSGGGSVTASMR